MALFVWEFALTKRLLLKVQEDDLKVLQEGIWHIPCVLLLYPA